MKMLEKHSLVMLNSEKVCEGLWTRIEGEEKSVIDYVIVNEEEKEVYKHMKIDEEKDMTPYSIENYDGKIRRVHTDHCMIKIEANMYVGTKRREEVRKKKETRQEKVGIIQC